MSGEVQSCVMLLDGALQRSSHCLLCLMYVEECEVTSNVTWRHYDGTDIGPAALMKVVWQTCWKTSLHMKLIRAELKEP